MYTVLVCVACIRAAMDKPSARLHNVRSVAEAEGKLASDPEMQTEVEPSAPREECGVFHVKGCPAPKGGECLEAAAPAADAPESLGARVAEYHHDFVESTPGVTTCGHRGERCGLTREQH
jgi:hypothetical protein